jgi:DNA repair exonuclease SbcCD ATPase subunit
MDVIKKKLQMLKEERDTAVEKAEEAERLRKETEAQLEAAEQDITRLNNKVSLLEGDLEQAEDRAADCDTKLKAEEAEKEELLRTNRTLSTQITEMEGEQGEEVIIKLRADLKQAEGGIDELTQANQSMRHQIDQLEGDLEKAEENYEKAKQELEATLSELGDL